MLFNPKQTNPAQRALTIEERIGQCADYFLKHAVPHSNGRYSPTEVALARLAAARVVGLEEAAAATEKETRLKLSAVGRWPLQHLLEEVRRRLPSGHIALITGEVQPATDSRSAEEASRIKSPEKSPANHGKPWTFEDDVSLAVGYRQGMTLERLAEHFKRDPDAIVTRVAKLSDSFEAVNRHLNIDERRATEKYKQFYFGGSRNWEISSTSAFCKRRIKGQTAGSNEFRRWAVLLHAALICEGRGL
jgi:hypothetical protein